MCVRVCLWVCVCTSYLVDGNAAGWCLSCDLPAVAAWILQGSHCRSLLCDFSPEQEAGIRLNTLVLSTVATDVFWVIQSISNRQKVSNTLTRNSDLFTLVYGVGRKYIKNFFYSDTNYLWWNLFKSLVEISTHSCDNDAQLQNKSAVICRSNSYYGLKSSIDGFPTCFSSWPSRQTANQCHISLWETQSSNWCWRVRWKKSEWVKRQLRSRPSSEAWDSQNGLQRVIYCVKHHKMTKTDFLPKYSFTCSKTEYSNKNQQELQRHRIQTTNKKSAKIQFLQTNDKNVNLLENNKIFIKQPPFPKKNMFT